MIIDGKGRLFGKINIIDFTIIVFLFCFILIVINFGHRLLKTQRPISEKLEKMRKMSVLCIFAPVNTHDYRLISVGDKEIDENGKVIGEVTWVGKNRPFQYLSYNESGKKIIQVNPELNEIPVQLLVNAKITSGSLYYKDTQIKVGLSIEFSTNKYTLTAIPFNIEQINK